MIYAKPAPEIRVIQWHLADIYIDYEASTWLLYYSAWLREVDEENALSEYVATESAVRCARMFLDIYNHVRKRGFSLVNRGMEIFEKLLDLACGRRAEVPNVALNRA